jgi:hypothetical protein
MALAVLCLRVREDLPVRSVADFVKQKQEWALRFRDSSYSGGERRDRTSAKSLRNR